MAKKKNYASEKLKVKEKKVQERKLREADIAEKQSLKVQKGLAKAPHTAKTHKGRKMLEARMPQVHEPTKVSMLFKCSPRTSATLHTLLSELNMLRRPHSVFYSRKLQKELRPFDHEEELERFCFKNRASLFVGGSSTKKRPDYIIMGRMFNEKVLDIFEFSVQNFKSMREFNMGKHAPKADSKPLVICQGVNFESSEAMIAARNMFTDFFAGPKASRVMLKGLDRAVIITAIRRDPECSTHHHGTKSTEDFAAHAFLVRHYAVVLNKSSTPKLPHVELVEIGPSFDLIADRFNLASSDVWKASMKDPPEVSKRKPKNVSTTSLGETVGKIHVGRQKVDSLHTPHFHGIASEAPPEE